MPTKEGLAAAGPVRVVSVKLIMSTHTKGKKRKSTMNSKAGAKKINPVDLDKNREEDFFRINKGARL